MQCILEMRNSGYQHKCIQCKDLLMVVGVATLYRVCMHVLMQPQVTVSEILAHGTLFTRYFKGTIICGCKFQQIFQFATFSTSKN